MWPAAAVVCFVPLGCNTARWLLYRGGGYRGGCPVLGDADLPRLLLHSLLGWNMVEVNFTTGALLGYSSVNSIVSLNVPSTGRSKNRRTFSLLMPWTQPAAAQQQTHPHPKVCPLARR